MAKIKTKLKWEILEFQLQTHNFYRLLETLEYVVLISKINNQCNSIKDFVIYQGFWKMLIGSAILLIFLAEDQKQLYSFNFISFSYIRIPLVAQNSSVLLLPKFAASLKLYDSTARWCFCWFLAKKLQVNMIAKMIAKINLQTWWNFLESARPNV